MARLGDMFLPFWNSSGLLPLFIIPLIFNCSPAFLSHLTSSFVALTIFTASLPPLASLYSGFGGTFFFFFHVLAAKSRQGFYECTCDCLSTFLVHNRHHTIVLTKSKAGFPPESDWKDYPLKQSVINVALLAVADHSGLQQLQKSSVFTFSLSVKQPVLLVNIVIIPLIDSLSLLFLSLFFTIFSSLCCSLVPPVSEQFVAKVCQPSFRQRSSKPVYNPDCSRHIVIAMVTSLELQRHLHHYLSFTENSHSVLIMYIIMWCIHYTWFNHHIFWEWIEVHFAFVFDELFTHNSILLWVVAVIFRPWLSDGKALASDPVKLWKDPLIQSEINFWLWISASKICTAIDDHNTSFS